MVVHRLGADGDEGLDWFHGLAEAPAGTAKRRTATGPPAARAARAESRNRLARHYIVKARQQLRRFFLHGGPEHGSHFIHLPLDALRPEDRCAEFLHPRQVEPLELLHLEHALQEEDLPAPGLEDAQALQLIRAAGHGELPKGMVEVPGEKLELLRFRVQIDVEVLAHD